jgi:tryptophan-rich sensory protein
VAGLSRRERRALRHIARALVEDDPLLASRLSDSTKTHSQLAAPVVVMFVVMAVALMLWGFAVGQMQMVVGGLVVLGTLPLVVGLLVFVFKTGPH